MPQDLVVINLDQLRIEGTVEAPIRGSEDPCLCDAGIGVEVRGCRKPSGLQRHCPGMTVPMVVIVVL
jgi:hypothetical protein